MRKIHFCVVSAFLLTSCNSIPITTPVYKNSSELFDVSQLRDYKVNQDQYLSYFASIALSDRLRYSYVSDGEKQELKITEDLEAEAPWSEITVAGWNYVDARCRDYLRELYAAKQGVSGLRKTTSAVGSATNTTLGLTTASANSIAIVAAAFSLAGNLFDITEETLLTVLPYESVNALVLRTQKEFQYLHTQTEIDTRSDAVAAIQGYLYLCEPSVIQANINNTIQSASRSSFYLNSGLLPTTDTDQRRQRLKAALVEIETRSKAASDAQIGNFTDG